MEYLYKRNSCWMPFRILLYILPSIIFTLSFTTTSHPATKRYAYVSDLTGSKVYVIDLAANSLIDSIAVYPPTGGMDPLLNGIKTFHDKAYLTVPGDMMGSLINQVKILSTGSNAVIGTLTTDQAPTGVAEYNGKIYILNSYSSSIQEINPSTDAIIRTIPFTSGFPNMPNRLEVTNDKIYLPCPGSGGTAGGVLVLDLLTGAKLKSIGFDSVDRYGPMGIKFVGFNKIYVGSHQDVVVIDAVSDSIVKKIRAKTETAGMINAFAVSGTKAFTANAEGTSSIIDVLADTLISMITVSYCNFCGSPAINVASSGDKVYMTIPWYGVKTIDAITDAVVDSIALSGNVSALDIFEQATIGILSISDVPNDQGKQVQIIWQKYSGEDVTTDPVRQYGVWRLDGSPQSMAKPSHPASPNSDNSFRGLEPGDRRSIYGEVWTFVGWSPVSGLPGYSLNVPTLFDSTVAHGMHWSTFRVSGHTADFSLKVWSDPDSGYSVDNLVPQAPLNLAAVVVPKAVMLTWEAPLDPDLDYYAVYRGMTEGFNFEQTTPIAQLTSTSFQDSNVSDGSNYYYVVRAFDFSGNGGKPSTASAIFTGIGSDAKLPAEYTLYQNFPNPFNPGTAIRYALPVTSRVRLQVCNPLGQVVAVLCEGIQSAGYQSAAWNAGLFSSGMYFTKLEAVSIADPNRTFTSVRKMLLVK